MTIAQPSNDLPEPDLIRQIYNLRGRSAVITGGGSGLGQAIAWGFACFGADVAILDRNIGAGKAIADRISADTGRRAIALEVEVSNERDVERAIAHVGSTFDGIDILVNGAGHNIRKPLVDMSREEFDSITDVHVRGAFLTCRAVGLLMRQRQKGSIINVASIAGHVGIPNVAAYAAAKGALIQMTKSLSLEMASYGVRVNALCPGYFATPLTLQHAPEVRRAVAGETPLGRFGEPKELIGPALFLASDASSFVTGTSMLIDGGWTAR